MKMIVVLLIATAITSCGKEPKKTSVDMMQEEVINKAAMPYISKEITVLDFNVSIARDATSDTIFRTIAISNIRICGPEYLHAASLENISSPVFESWLESQKKLIVNRWKEMQRNKQYKLSAIEQFGN